MIAKIAGAAALMAGLALAGAAGAQGFSEGGAAGVAALRGTTASPGYGFYGRGAGESAGGGVAAVPEPGARPRSRVAPTDVDFAPRRGPSDGGLLPF